VFGLLLTMVDRRAAMAGEVEAALRATYGDLVFTATIETIPNHGQGILEAFSLS
jgi:hypothetical protein